MVIYSKGLLFAGAILALLCTVSAEDLLMPNETWETGYVPVRGSQNELFYYLVKARNKDPAAPLMVWLNGGPGCSSSYGLFIENGPYIVHPETLAFYHNQYSWNNFADMIFVDQPVQVGYSLVRGDADLCVNQTCVARDFYMFLVGFLERHPEYRARPLYLSGESYAGHYVPSIAATLHKAGNHDLNLKGIAVGNPFTSMDTQIGAYAYYLLENAKFSTFQHIIAKAASLICQIGHVVKLDPILLTQICDFSLGHMVELANMYDIRMNKSYEKMETVVENRLREPEIRKLIGARKSSLNICNDTIYDLFSVDFARSMAPHVEYLIDHNVDVMLYFGDKDFICNWRGGEALVNSLKWTGEKGFASATMKEWAPDSTASGRYRKFGALNFMVVYGAGHMVPLDQGLAALRMIKSFVAREF